MNKLIEFFNKKYGDKYGKTSYPRTTLQIYRVYQTIKSYGIEDEELTELLHKVELPKPRNTEEWELYVDCLYNMDDSELERKLKDAPKGTSIEEGRIYLLKENGDKIDEGTELPSIEEQVGENKTIQIFTDLATTEVSFSDDKTIVESLDTLIDTVDLKINQVFRGQSYAKDNPISGNCEIQIEILKTEMNNGTKDYVCQITLTSVTDAPYKWIMLTRRTAGATSSRVCIPLTPMITDVNKEYVDNSLKNKVDKVEGKGLSTVDFTTAYETKLKKLENYNDTIIKNDIEDINTQLEDIAKKIDSGNIGNNVEPQLMDIPRIYFSEGTLPTTKTATTLKFDYYSKTEEYHGWAEIKCQGNSSMAYNKKNFTIKLYKDKEKTQKLKIDFKGWGKQSKFVLKANWIDITHARNIVSARIWADIVKSRNDYDTLPELFKTSPNQGAIDGFPITVYGNGYYQGRYTLNIPKDKWMTNMDDSLDTHCILCGENYVSGCFRALPTINGSDWTDEIHDAVPDIIKTSWTTAINFVMTSSDADFKTNLHNYFNVPSLIDYILFGILSTGLDAFGKNQIYMTYDAETWLGVMYDMDSTWGLYWNGSQILSNTYSREQFEDYKNTSNQGNLLYVRLQQLFINEIKARYAELRQSIFTYPYLVNKFEEFIQICPQDIVKEDYASTTANGTHTSIPSKTTNNIQQIRDNIKARLEYMDSYINGLIESVPCTGITLDKTSLTFTTTDAQTVTPTVTPTNTTDVTTWSVSPSGICTIVNGVVTPIGNGSCVITATCGSKTATCDVTVSGITTKYTITNNLTNCINSNSTTTIEENSSYTATITASDGYTLGDITVIMGGTDISSTAVSNGMITINSVTGDIIIKANGVSSFTPIVSTGEELTLYDGTFNGNTQEVYCEIDLSNCKNKNENILSAGNDISNWPGNNMHIYYDNASKTLQINFTDDNSLYARRAIILTNTNLYIKLNKNGLYVNNEPISITANDGNRPEAFNDYFNNFTLFTSIQVGAKENSVLSNATYNNFIIRDITV